MYEGRHDPLLSRAAFLHRLSTHASIALVIIAGSLTVGIFGYHFLEDLHWIDALLNAAMILGGMGPVSELHTASGKIFASLYALYSGLIVLVVAGILFAPVLHRFLHRFHLDLEDDERVAAKRSPRPERAEASTRPKI
jgi:hypothetical protein